jgi:DNA-binding protein YbaB
MLIVAGCSSDSGSGDDAQKAGADTNAGATVSAAPTVQAAAYQSLPEACAVLSKGTLTELVPEGKKGKEGASSDTATRASCSWSSLDNNGVKGSQFRWLNVSLLRFESDTASSGDQQAQEYYAKQVQGAQAVAGATNTKTQALAGTGDQATTVRYDLKKKEGAFKQQTVVARVENVVVTVDYNGAGLAGEKTPSADTLTKAAEKAAKEAVAAVQSANGEGTGAGSSTAPSPGKSAATTPSASASKSSSASPSVSPSASASKKS